MTDPRPSENTDPIQLPGMRAAGFFDDVPKCDVDFFMEPANDDQDPIEDLIERAENAHDHTLGLVFAQLATVRAVQAQTEPLTETALRDLIVTDPPAADWRPDPKDLA